MIRSWNERGKSTVWADSLSALLGALIEIWKSPFKWNIYGFSPEIIAPIIRTEFVLVFFIKEFELFTQTLPSKHSKIDIIVIVQSEIIFPQRENVVKHVQYMYM